MRPYLEKKITKIEVVEWFKVKALSSNLSTTKKKYLVQGLVCYYHFLRPGMIVYACNPSTKKVEAGGSQVAASLSYNKKTLSPKRKKKCCFFFFLHQDTGV
jgi:hypothetical protein